MRRDLLLLACAGAICLAGCGRSDESLDDRSGAASRGLSLAPATPDITTELRAVVDVQGIDPARCGYEWTLNGTVLAGETGAVLAPGRLHKGDDVRVEVRTPASSHLAGRTLSAGVRVGDAAPRVSDAWVKPAATGTGYSFTGIAECVDPDGDPLTCARQWYRNGQPISGATDSTLVLPSIVTGDRIAVEIVCTDGERRSEPRRSREFVLSDRPPTFTSRPPAVGAGDTEYRYQAAATDPDGDGLRYELVQAPAGATLSPEGLLEWRFPPPAGRSGGYRFVIRAADARGGAATQTLELTLPATPANSSKT